MKDRSKLHPALQSGLRVLRELAMASGGSETEYADHKVKIAQQRGHERAEVFWLAIKKLCIAGA